MTDDTRVAIIDDDKLSSYSLNVKLKFIGEKPLNLNSANWRKFFGRDERAEQVCALIVGKLEATTMASLLRDLNDAGVNVPLLLAGEPVQLDDLAAEIRERIIGVRQRPMHYQDLLDALVEARRRLGLADREFRSGIISSTGTAMFRSLVGQSPGMRQVRELIDQLAGRQTPVLITGESGTGKEIAARQLHYYSGRSHAPFIVVNCAAASADHLARELFGEEGQAAEGHAVRSGLVREADGGTLFLDVVDEMPLTVQGMLLRFLEQRDAAGSDARIIAATHADLEECIARGRFREDLYYRLNVVPMQLPPLRERAEDLPDLLHELVSRLENTSQGSLRFNTAAIRSLQRHSWPGNVRELANLVERLSIVRVNEVVGLNDLPGNYRHIGDDEAERLESAALVEPADKGGGADPGRVSALAALGPVTAANLGEYLANFEKNLVEVALEDCAGRQALAAERLQASPEWLEDRIRRHGLA